MARTRRCSPFLSILHFCGPVVAGALLSFAAITARLPAEQAEHSIAATPLAQQSSAPAASDVRAARRTLAKRMRKAIAQRADYAQRAVAARFVDDKGNTVGVWQVSLAEHASWIAYDMQRSEPIARIDQQAIASSMGDAAVVALARPVHCDLQSMQDDKYKVLRAETSCIARSGYDFDAAALARILAEALQNAEEHVDLPVIAVAGTVRDTQGLGLGDAQVLAVGKSNFKGSGAGRKANVRKAIGERVHNVVVPADAVFSFNDVLGGPVTQSAGWHMALTIFEGVNLREAPGGGICQASTTVYRAVLQAGLPIVEQKNHSLYVSYYEAYGVGQDAAVFPGKQNLRFRNDTGAPLLLQSYYDGEDAYVHILGRPDGRAVTVDGPYFSTTAPAHVLVNNRPVRSNEIVWLRTITAADNTTTTQTFVSRYNAVPKSLVAKWPATSQVVTLHAAAPSTVEAR